MTQLWKIDVITRVEYLDPYLTLMEQQVKTSSWQLIDDDTRVHLQGICDTAKEADVAKTHLVASLLGEDESATCSVSKIPAVNWVAQFAESCPPLRVGPFYIFGSHWRHKPKPLHSIPLWIDAATAFGSGEHATTSGCLRALSEIKKYFQPRRVLDMGCGTGILSIGASRLWPQCTVVAGDIDPEAVRIARINATRNKSRLTLLHCRGFASKEIHRHGPYDLIVANILAKPLCHMAPAMASHLNKGGLLILSGLLSWQEKLVLNTFLKQGFHKIKTIAQENWHTLVLKK